MFLKDENNKRPWKMWEIYPKNVCISEKEKSIRTVAIIKCMPKETSTKLKLKKKHTQHRIQWIHHIIGKINENIFFYPETIGYFFNVKEKE